MFRIAFCDENHESMAELLSQLKELSEEIRLELHVDMFDSVERLSEAMARETYHLLFLEVFVGETNSLEFVHKLRMVKNNVEVIFLTDNSKYALAAYNVFPLGYLLKPANKKRIRPFFRRAVDKYRRKPAILLRSENGVKTAVNIDDILYIEVFRTELDVHCIDGKVVCNGSLAETYSLLPEREFYRSHRSFIVNLKYVSRIERYQFTMTNGDKVAVAKNRYAEAKLILKDFVSD